MINYALSLILFISVIPSKETLEKRFENTISKASVSFSENEIEHAKMYAFQAHEMAKDYSYDWGVAKALFVLAFLHEKDLEYEKALPYYLEVLDQYDDFNTPQSILDKSKVLFNIGCIMMVNDKYQEAIKFYDEGIAYAQEYELNEMLLDNLHNKIIVCNDAGLFDLAMETIVFKNSIIDSSNLPERLKTKNELGLLYKSMNQIEKAKIEYKSILSAEKDNPSNSFSGKAHINLGIIFDKEGNYESARIEFGHALKLAVKENKIQDIFQIHQSLALVEKSIGNLLKSIQHAEESVSLFDQVAKTKENIKIHSQISDLYLETGNIAAGKLHAKTYASEISDLFDRQEKLNSIGNQYKIDFITSNYFNKIEKRQTLFIFLSIIGSMILSFLIYLSYQQYKKILIARLIREQMNSVSFDIDDL